MLYHQTMDHCFANKIGDLGIQNDAFQDILKQTKTILTQLNTQCNEGLLPLFAIAPNDTKLEEISQIARNIREKFANLVVLGTGGSTLTGQAITGLTAFQRTCNPGKTTLHFMDNVDPESCNQLLNSLAMEDTFFLVISKSGNTLETLAQFFACIKQARQSLNDAVLKYHFTIITDPKDSPLRQIADNLSLPIIDHEELIGGRFSIFTNVGLIPAAVIGMDIYAFYKGAAQVAQATLGHEGDTYSDAAQGGALNYLMMENAIHNTVLMTYINRLQPFITWIRQIWSESLGKGGNGSTPIPALGTLDQHSQLQLYLDGPRDKLFTFFTLNNHGKGEILDTDILDHKSLSYIKGKTLGDVIAVSQQATIETLINNKFPVRHIALEQLNEEVLGALAMHFTLETVITAHLLKINPFDQPAVEEGKLLARKYLQEQSSKKAA